MLQFGKVEAISTVQRAQLLVDSTPFTVFAIIAILRTFMYGGVDAVRKIV